MNSLPPRVNGHFHIELIPPQHAPVHPIPYHYGCPLLDGKPVYQSFSEIWERNEPWPTGPLLLGQMAAFMRGKRISAKLSPSNNVIIDLPLVPVCTQHWDVPVPAPLLFPEHLHPTWVALALRLVEVPFGALMNSVIGMPASPALVKRLNDIFAGFEQQQFECGYPQLWEAFTHGCGLNPIAIPQAPVPAQENPT